MASAFCESSISTTMSQDCVAVFMNELIVSKLSVPDVGAKWHIDMFYYRVVVSLT